MIPWTGDDPATVEALMDLGVDPAPSRRAGSVSDLAVGIDDHHLADLLDLTTVRQPLAQQDLVAGQLVHQIL